MEGAAQGIVSLFVISNSTQFREALTRLRYLEGSAETSSEGLECGALELAVSRYLALSEEGYRSAYEGDGV